MSPTIIDLHTHTTYSDGELTPYELLSAAKELGCELIAVTDHDSVFGISEAKKAAEEIGIKLIPGIEISTQEKEEVHMLGLGIDENNEALRNACQEFIDEREKRGERIVAFLATKGIEVDLDEVREIAGKAALVRPHFAHYLVRHGHVRTVPEAFERYLNTPAFHAAVTRRKPTPQEAIKLIHEAGGKAVLAHPCQLKKNDADLEKFVMELKEAGLDGMECIYFKQTPAQQRKFLAMAKRHGLKISCGSDFHGVHVKPDVPLGMKLDVEAYDLIYNP